MRLIGFPVPPTDLGGLGADHRARVDIGEESNLIPVHTRGEACEGDVQLDHARRRVRDRGGVDAERDEEEHADGCLRHSGGLALQPLGRPVARSAAGGAALACFGAEVEGEPSRVGKPHGNQQLGQQW